MKGVFRVDSNETESRGTAIQLLLSGAPREQALIVSECAIRKQIKAFSGNGLDCLIIKKRIKCSYQTVVHFFHKQGFTLKIPQP